MPPSGGGKGGFVGGAVNMLTAAIQRQLDANKTKDSGDIQPVTQPISRPSARRNRSPSITSAMLPDFESGGSRGKTLLGQ